MSGDPIWISSKNSFEAKVTYWFVDAIALSLFDYSFSENGLKAYKKGELIYQGVSHTGPLTVTTELHCVSWRRQVQKAGKFPVKRNCRY